MRVLVTRPIQEAETTAQAISARGHEAVIAPMLVIRHRATPIPIEGVEAVIVTSANALAAVEDRPEKAALLRLPLLAVGQRTAAAARRAGFGEVTGADGDVMALAGVIREWARKPLRFLHLAGEDRVADLGALIADQGHEVAIATVYDAVKADRFGPEAERMLREGAIDAVTHFSARTAEAFVACAQGVVSLETARLRHLCLSERVAQPLRAAGATVVAVAARRDEAALLDLIAP